MAAMPGGSASEEERVAAVRDLHLLDSPPEERFDRVVRLAQHIFDVPYVAVNLIDEDRQFTKAAAGDRFGPPSTSKPRAESLCSIAIQGDRTLEIPDLRTDPAWAGHPVTQEGSVGYYAGAPLRAPGGHRIGALCLVDVAPRRELSVGEQAMLRDLAGWVERELATGAELEQGAELQRRLLPRGIPDLPGWEMAGQCEQAGAVGGDFYDWQVLRNTGQVQVVLADVMGKGLQAALLAAGIRAIFRGTSPHNTLSASVRRVADDMDEDLTEIGSFVTFFAVRFDPADGTTEYVDAGHGLAFLVGPDRAVRLSGDSLPLGAAPGDPWEPRPERISPGEMLVILSDGFLDVHGDPDRVLEVVRAAAATDNDATGIASRLVRSALGRLTTDDVTIVVVRRLAG
ncbi:PP2C family protein-serine/threonine phosphatase [Nocardioides antri]|uniref:SpoIIE family protein phosphatase n=1 Tax=Nocardioides antri TaxID=2607659 RepID=A0A5B1M1P6_9ACTN|nr:SpoIIE family protein phosphatase [Nocardioides antri]KAA1426398.1 SpoIIE family protein phosphatase [Nocardioides antri]